MYIYIYMYSKIAGKVQELMHGAKSLRVSCTGTGVGMVGHLEKGHLNPQSCIDVFVFLSSKNECFFYFFLVKYGLILRWDFVWIPIDFKINLINIIYWFQDLIKQRLKRLIVINIRCSRYKERLAFSFGISASLRYRGARHTTNIGGVDLWVGKQ